MERQLQVGDFLVRDVHEATRRKLFEQVTPWICDKVEPGEPVVVLGDLKLVAARGGGQGHPGG